MKILLIEDEEILSKVLKEQFEDEGFDVVIMSDGEGALNKTIQYKPDIIILDLTLPKKSGFEVLEELKKTTETKSIPVIVLSNSDKDVSITRAMKLGATDYMVKNEHPMAEIVEKIKNLLVLHKK